MKKEESYRCVACGTGTVSLVARPNRIDEYYFVDLAVPEDLEIPTCNTCGEGWFDWEDAERFDSAMAKVYADYMCEDYVA